MNLSINELSIFFSEASKNLTDFLITFSSIFFTATIGWFVYKHQQREKRLKDDITNFSLLFFSITNNLETTTAIINKVNKVIKEINIFIEAITKMKYLIDCFHNKQSLDLIIQLPNEDAKKEYIITELDKLRENLVLRETYTKSVGKLHDTNYEKDALFLVNWGNLKFQSIYKNLVSEYKTANQLTDLINQNIEDETKNDKKRHRLIFICDINDKDYLYKIEQKTQEILFYKNLYESLQESTECILFYTDLAYKHLMHFNSKYVEKYSRIIFNLDIEFLKLSIGNKIYNLEDLMYYKNNINKYQIYSELPPYKLLNKTIFEKCISFFNKNKIKDKK